MPFYEYECAHCKFYKEVMQKVSDAPLKKCPSCGRNALKKLVSAPVFRLKGAGWYETDFKSDKDNKRNLAGSDKEDSSVKSETKTDSKTETGAPAAGDGKSETKTEAKAETKPDGKSAGKGETTAPTAAPKPPAPTTRNVAARSAHRGGKGTTAGKSAPSKRASPPRRKASKRRGGR
jgi:putative FmdB family regulatory protein